MPKPVINRKHQEVDAAGQAVGRVAARVVTILRGKDKATFAPHIDAGDMVTVINASQVKFTGRKLVQKDYKRHTMHPGGLKVTSMKKVYEEDVTDVIRRAVYGMLPKNKHRELMIQRLTVKA